MRERPDDAWQVWMNLLAEAPKLWQRFQAARGTTTTYNSSLPTGVETRLPFEVEAIVYDWFAAEESFWGWSETSDLVRNDPENAWLVILAIVRQATTEDCRCN